jgi:sec-independent protein translocase protein TatB
LFDMSWSELLLIAVVALIVIGPKDLPRVVKTFVQFARKARNLAREFQAGVEEMSREAELDSLKSEIEAAGSTDFHHEIQNTIDPGGMLTKDLDLQSADAASVPAIEAKPAEPSARAEPAANEAPAEAPASAAPHAAEPGHAEPVPVETAKG